MQQGQSILFHCDTGRTRAPCLLAVWISRVRASGGLYTVPLWTMGEYIFPARKVNELFHTLYHEKIILGNEKWCSAAYRDYVMVCRIRYETALYHQYEGWVKPPGTPIKDESHRQAQRDRDMELEQPQAIPYDPSGDWVDARGEIMPYFKTLPVPAERYVSAIIPPPSQQSLPYREAPVTHTNQGVDAAHEIDF